MFTIENGYLSNIFICAVILLALTGCGSGGEQKADKAYRIFKQIAGKPGPTYREAGIAREVANNHYDLNKRREAGAWVKKYEADSAFTAANRVHDSLPGIGKISLLELDNGNSKCNLVRGSYLITANHLDSDKVVNAVRYYAKKLFLNSKHNKNCSYKLTASAYLFARKSDFDNGNVPLAGCIVTPENANGEVHVDPDVLKSFNGRYTLKVKDSTTLIDILKK